MFVHYFARENAQGQPILRDGTVIVPSIKHHAEGEIILCENGFHGSILALDALKYANGHWYCPRELSGEIVAEADKNALALWLAGRFGRPVERGVALRHQHFN